MSAQIIKPASITLDIAGKSLDVEEIVADPALSAQLTQAIATFVEAVS